MVMAVYDMTVAKSFDNCRKWIEECFQVNRAQQRKTATGKKNHLLSPQTDANETSSETLLLVCKVMNCDQRKVKGVLVGAKSDLKDFAEVKSEDAAALAKEFDLAFFVRPKNAAVFFPFAVSRAKYRTRCCAVVNVFIC